MKNQRKKEPWVVFTYQGRELAAYTVRGTFPGEMEATKELLAAEHSCRQEDIQVRTENRA